MDTGGHDLGLQGRQPVDDGLLRQSIGLGGDEALLTLDQEADAIPLSLGVRLGLLELFRVLDDAVREPLDEPGQALLRLAQLTLQLREHLVRFLQP
ncbi:hypothetical protein [uncultured Brevundimonas sp.]|uniref:hypothetical protein n=1 Tax=uncultured Brevundimonas sp. TaxID=213418 RepID=UPI002596F2D3|nr:hypothetical protein [uncultured Brevundimonas sp.]